MEMFCFQLPFQGPFTHTIFDAIFCSAHQCNFCRKCKLAAISLRFLCKSSSCCFPKIAAKFHQVSNKFDISTTSHRNCTEITKLVYTYDFIANLSATKIAMESATKIAQKIGYVNGPLERNTIFLYLQSFYHNNYW